MIEGWLNKNLEDICIIGDGNHSSKYPKKSEMVANGVPFIRATNLVNGCICKDELLYISEEKHQELKKGHLKTDDVLFTNRGEIGKVAIVDKSLNKANLNSQIAWLRCKEELLPRYLFFFLQSNKMRRYFAQTKSGAALQQFTIAMIKSVVISYPSLREQKRIVAILDEVFEGIDRAIANTEKNLANAHELFKSIIETTIFGSSNSKDWQLKTVTDVVFPKKGSMRTGPFGSQLLHSEFIDEGIAVLGIDNAVDNEFRWGKRRFISLEKFNQLSRYKVYPGDVLITIMGTCGRCAIVPDDIPTAINSKHLCCITLDQNQCLPGFLHAYFLYHPIAQTFLTERAKGSIMSGLNMEIIKELPLKLPPVSGQQIIIEKVQFLTCETRKLETIYQNKVASLNELKQSILQKAFTGELTADTANEVTNKAKKVIAA